MVVGDNFNFYEWIFTFTNNRRISNDGFFLFIRIPYIRFEQLEQFLPDSRIPMEHEPGFIRRVDKKGICVLRSRRTGREAGIGSIRPLPSLVLNSFEHARNAHALPE